jgi:hypothetical protein
MTACVCFAECHASVTPDVERHAGLTPDMEWSGAR